MLKKLEEANAQMKSDMEKMQEELDTEEQLRKRQEEQVVHNKPLFITSDLLLFIALIWGEKPICSLCVPAHKTGRDVKKTRERGHRA